MTETPIQRLQNLLGEIFRFGSADLDFGLYRLLHLKRQEIEAFLTEQLPRLSREVFASLGEDDRAHLEDEMNSLAGRIRSEINPGALAPDGAVREAYRNSPIAVVRGLVERYEEARRRLREAGISETRQNEVFNHLCNFFSRYYGDGDFIPRRRYGETESYAVPWDGRDVSFQWATRDMHYVKSSETLKDYSFIVNTVQGDWRVRFVLVEASVPPGDLRGERRFFVPRPEAAVVAGADREFQLPFEFRPLTEDEVERHGANAAAQEAVLAAAGEAILDAVGDVTLRAVLAADQCTGLEANDNRPEISLLSKHLRHFTRRQTSDFFVHRNLRGFLERELEFYLKDQVLNIMDVGGDLDAKRRMIKVLRQLAGNIVEFLAQVEDVQRRLFEKKKFVLETQYCLAVGRVADEFHRAIADSDAQWAEWKELFHVDEAEANLFTAGGNVRERRLAFLRGHPTLVLDTEHFGRDFRDSLLASFKDLDEETDGLLVHGENYQALRLLSERHRGEVQCVHIDPPYNTQTSGFLYKNDYQHSSWLTMMRERLGAAIPLLEEKGHLLCHIDENEYERLMILFDDTSLPDAGTVVWDKRNPMTAGRGIALQHEYIIWRSRTERPIYERNDTIQLLLRTAEEIIGRYGGVNDVARREYAQWVRENPELSGGEKAYRFIDNDGKIYQSVSLRAPELRTDPRFFEPLFHPVTGQPCSIPPNGFSRTPETLRAMVERGEIIFGPDETTQPRQKRFLDAETNMQVRSVIQDARRGKEVLSAMGLDFPYCHAVSLYHKLVGATTSADESAVLDFFAGSGTTAHAVIDLNRGDGGRRKFILVEMADYFDTVLLPRVKKVIYSPEWRDGRPRRPATAEEARRGPRIVKYLRLESYEDALHNLAADDTRARAAAREGAVKHVAGADEYRLRYLFRLPLEAAETMLSLEKLAHPFDYELEMLTEHGPVKKKADLVETFNYLYGLRVRQMATWTNPDDRSGGEPGGRLYRLVRATDRARRRRVLVIWRDMDGLDAEMERAFLAARIRDEATVYDEILINGDAAVPGVNSLDGLFRRLMAAGEEGAA